MNKKFRKKFVAVAALSAMTLSMLAGCGKKSKEATPTDATTESDSFNVSPISNMEAAGDIQVVYREGMVLSDLTGEWIDESLANQRPLCIMINNIIDAMPQSGISQADITYEFIVEGGITRLMCVFKDYSNIEKLGPVRSSRHYYVQTAVTLDGIYAHYGWSIYAQAYIENNPDLVDNLNGLSLDSIMYYRDSSRVAPHNVYTNTEGILAGIEKCGYDTDHSSRYTGENFKFNYSDTALNSGNKATKVTTAFNASRAPWFEYHEDDGRYYRFQYGEEQIDDQTGEQLSYKNVIVMNCEYETLDDYGCQNILWDYDGATGTGYYITDGEYVPITWTKYENGIYYYNEDGSQLKMNPGNTYISVIDINQSSVTFE